MATYHKVIETPETNIQNNRETVVSCSVDKLEIPEKYVSAVTKIEILRRLCAAEKKEADVNNYAGHLYIVTIMAVIGDV